MYTIFASLYFLFCSILVYINKGPAGPSSLLFSRSVSSSEIGLFPSGCSCGRTPTGTVRLLLWNRRRMKVVFIFLKAFIFFFFVLGSNDNIYHIMNVIQPFLSPLHLSHMLEQFKVCGQEVTCIQEPEFRDNIETHLVFVLLQGVGILSKLETDDWRVSLWISSYFGSYLGIFMQ